ncbi:MAG: hypothetical protein WCK39_07415 [Methanomassiliicoccales archaeon]
MEMEVEKPFLMAVMNEAFRHGDEYLTISSPLLDADLLRISLRDFQVELLCTRDSLHLAADRLNLRLNDGLSGGDRGGRDDIPDFNDLRDALCSSLVLPPENLSELVARVQQMEAKRDDPRLFRNDPRQDCFAIDTNIAYLRLMSRLHADSHACKLRNFDPSKVQVVLSGLVSEEIAAGVGRKYSASDVERWKRAMANPRLAAGMANITLKKGRKAQNAQAEIFRIRERYAFWEIPSNKFDVDKEKRDHDLLSSLRDAMAGRHWNIIFLSADDKAAESAASYGVAALPIKYPPDVPVRMQAGPWRTLELLHDLSIVFVMLQFKGLGVRVHGDWTGKRGEQYKEEMLKLVIDDQAKVAEDLQKDKRIADRLMAVPGAAGMH